MALPMVDYGLVTQRDCPNKGLHCLEEQANITITSAKLTAQDLVGWQGECAGHTTDPTQQPSPDHYSPLHYRLIS